VREAGHLAKDDYGLTKLCRAAKGVSADITITNSVNIYNFNSTALLASYGVALFLTTFCIALGIVAYRTNGGARSLTYSAMVEAARSSHQQDQEDLPLQPLEDREEATRH
jgi:hypothetical protein